MSAIPILLLTGYLGAGKTTLLNSLLGQSALAGRRIALLINEFGALGVDGEQVRPGEWQRFELNKGCLFCSCVKTDFLAMLQEIRDTVQPDVLLIEATGMTEPRDLEAFVDEPHLARSFAIQANLCIVDAQHFLAVLPHLRVAHAQVAWADALIVNKRDLATPGEAATLREVLRSINPDAPLIETQYGAVPEGWLATLRHVRRAGALLDAPPDPVFSETFETRQPVDRARLRAILEALDGQALRMKGRVDDGRGAVFMELAGGRIVEDPARAAGKTGTAFVVIAWKIRQAELRRQIESAWEP